ncbi:MAG: hypothetical protein WB474_12965 [Nitrososphaeraceae archaeon]
MVKQKSETNELKTGLSSSVDILVQYCKELTVKKPKIYRLVYHIVNLQSALYYTLYFMGKLADKILEVGKHLI